MIILKNKAWETFDKVEASEELKQQTLRYVLNENKIKRRNYKAPIGIFASFCIVFLVYFQFMQPKTIQAYSYITMDINPSFQLVLNQDDHVQEIVYYNEEAQSVLKSLDMKGKEYEEALTLILTNKEYKTYMKEDAYLQVSVYSKDEKRANNIEQNVSTYLNKNVKIPHECIHVNEKTMQNAQSHHMSSGKYMVIEKIVKADASYKVDDLKNKSMAELRTIYYTITNEELDTKGNHQNGNGNQNHKHQGKNQ